MHRILSLLVFLALLYSGQASCANTKPVPITATSWLVADENGRTIQSQNSSEQRSIASISKLMTVMVVLDQEQDMNEKISGYSREEWILLALIKSDNHAAQVLCDNYFGGRIACITAMNAKAQSLNLPNTHFVEPTGLSIMNVSTADELVKIVIAASKYPLIVECAKIAHAKIKKKKRFWTFNNTNPRVDSYNFVVSKTGYIRASGGCIVIMMDTNLGRRIVILLNSKNTRTRIPEAISLAHNY